MECLNVNTRIPSQQGRNGPETGAKGRAGPDPVRGRPAKGVTPPAAPEMSRNAPQAVDQAPGMMSPGRGRVDQRPGRVLAERIAVEEHGQDDCGQGIPSGPARPTVRSGAGAVRCDFGDFGRDHARVDADCQERGQEPVTPGQAGNGLRAMDDGQRQHPGCDRSADRGKALRGPHSAAACELRGLRLPPSPSGPGALGCTVDRGDPVEYRCFGLGTKPPLFWPAR